MYPASGRPLTLVGETVGCVVADPVASSLFEVSLYAKIISVGEGVASDSDEVIAGVPLTVPVGTVVGEGLRAISFE